MMEKWRFRCRASTSLNWGEGYFYFSFYSVQDCPRSTLALPEVMYTMHNNPEEKLAAGARSQTAEKNQVNNK